MEQLLVILFISLFYIVNCQQSYRYEKQNRFGAGRTIIPNLKFFLENRKSYAHPEPLPENTHHNIKQIIPSPYENLYQGVRRLGDKRVYNNKFNYKPKELGHHVHCQQRFDCVISHMALETKGGIPVILRGGAGYRFFEVIAKAKPGRRLQGSIQAFCRNKVDPYYKTRRRPVTDSPGLHLEPFDE